MDPLLSTVCLNSSHGLKESLILHFLEILSLMQTSNFCQFYLYVCESLSEMLDTILRYKSIIQHMEMARERGVFISLCSVYRYITCGQISKKCRTQG